jgi:hypothetical protein
MNVEMSRANEPNGPRPVIVRYLTKNSQITYEMNNVLTSIKSPHSAIDSPTSIANNIDKPRIIPAIKNQTTLLPNSLNNGSISPSPGNG